MIFTNLERDDGAVSEQTGGAGRNQVMFYVVGALLIGSFLWRLFTPAHEYPMRSEQVLTMVLDGCLTAGFWGLWKAAKGPDALFWTGLAAGIGLFLIRFHSNASWWTGHYSYWILPR